MENEIKEIGATEPSFVWGVIKKHVEAHKIEVWKEEHGAIFGYVTPDGRWCILKQPSLMVLDACSAMSRGNDFQFDVNLVENCWLEGDKSLKNDAGCFMGLRRWVYQIIKIVDGKLEEL